MMYRGPSTKPFHKSECRCERCLQWVVDELERLRTAVKPFTDANLLPPDNWPGQCRVRIDNRESDGSEYLSYHGEPQEHLGILPTLAEWRALHNLVD